MERTELITHLEHLAEYVKYSEDAPALREVIEILRCSEMPNSSKDFFWKNARKNARKYTETHACDLIERETARRIIDSPRSKEQMLWMLRATPPAQPDHSADVSKMVNGDVVSRREAIDAIGKKSDEIYKTKQKGATYPHDDFFQGMAYAESVVKELPSAQPEIIRCNACKHWTQTIGDMPGFGLGDCDYHNAKLVNCNLYCSWAERREDG